MSYGFAGYIGLGREATWGSAQAANVFIEALNENVSVTIDRFDFKNIIATLAEPDDQAGVHRIGGSLAFAAHPEVIGPFLQSTFNLSTITEVLSGSLYTHDYTQPTDSGSAFSDESPSVPYTFEIFRDVSTCVAYAGGLVSALSFNFAPNQDVRCNATIVGRSAAPAAKQTPTFPGSPAKPFTFDTVSLQLGAGATTDIENLTVSIENQYEGIPVLNNSQYVGKVRRTGHQMVNISGTIDFVNMNEYDNFIAQTEQQMVVHATKANSFALTLDVPRMVFTGFPLGIPGKDRITVDFDAKGFYHSGSGTGIGITLTTQSSYF